MLNNLSEQVRQFLEDVEACAHRPAPKSEPDPNTPQDFVDLEQRWLGLARSYMEQLYAFSAHNWVHGKPRRKL